MPRGGSMPSDRLGELAGMDVAGTCGMLLRLVVVAVDLAGGDGSDLVRPARR